MHHVGAVSSEHDQEPRELAEALTAHHRQDSRPGLSEISPHQRHRVVATYRRRHLPPLLPGRSSDTDGVPFGPAVFACRVWRRARAEVASHPQSFAAGYAAWAKLRKVRRPSLKVLSTTVLRHEKHDRDVDELTKRDRRQQGEQTFAQGIGDDPRGDRGGHHRSQRDKGQAEPVPVALLPDGDGEEHQVNETGGELAGAPRR